MSAASASDASAARVNTTLAAWSVAHACAMLLALALSALGHVVWPLGAVVLAFMLGLLRRARVLHLVEQLHGPANLVTTLRLGLVIALALEPAAHSGLMPALLSLCVLALDGVDGALARKLGHASAFGARYDMETDAAFVAVIAALVFCLDRAGSFVLVAGALRYAYVLVLALTRRSDRDAPRTLLGRSVFTIVVLANAAALAKLPYATPPLALANLLLVYSFARSLHWSVRAVPRGSNAESVPQ